MTNHPCLRVGRHGGALWMSVDGLFGVCVWFKQLLQQW
jgi:hypothetical protein